MAGSISPDHAGKLWLTNGSFRGPFFVLIPDTIQSLRASKVNSGVAEAVCKAFSKENISGSKRRLDHMLC
jgi:hypothetical protein